MNETIQSIIEWHTKTFPEATLDGQKTKFDEEIEEYTKAEKQADIANEMADLFIVACGIARFDNIAATAYFALVWHAYKESFILRPDFEKALNEKMAKNRKRVWNKTAEGTYHHEKGIED